MNTIRNCFVWGLLLVLLSLATGCGNRQTAAVLDDVETYIQDRPDSALAALRAIDTTTLNSRRLHAQYALLHSMALDKNWIDTTDVNVVMPAVAYYDRRRPVSRRAKPYYYLGRIQFNGGHYDEAIISFTRAGEFAENLEDNRFKALNNIALANTYTATSAYEESQHALVEAEKSGRFCQDSMLLYTILFREAQTLVNLNRHQEADSLFRVLTQENNPFVQRFPQVLGSYAMFLITPPNQQFGQARVLFEKAIQNRGKLESAQYWGMYAQCLANTGDIQKAEEIVNQLENGKQREHVSTSYSKSFIAASKGDYKSAYLLLQENHERLNEEMQKRLQQSTIKSQRDYYLLQRESLKKENQLRKGISSLLVLLVVATVTAIIFIVRHFRERVQQQNRDLMETVRDMMELRQANDNLISDKEKAFTQQLLLRRDFFLLNQENFKELSNLCNSYYKNEGRVSQARVVCGEVRGYMNKLGIGENRYPVLEQRVNEIFDRIMEHFRIEHPNHREQFFQAACYLFAGFQTRTIALLLHLDEKEVYRLKWRIKRDVESIESSHQKDFLTLLNGS